MRFSRLEIDDDSWFMVKLIFSRETVAFSNLRLSPSLTLCLFFSLSSFTCCCFNFSSFDSELLILTFNSSLFIVFSLIESIVLVIWILWVSRSRSLLFNASTFVCSSNSSFRF